MEASPTKSSFVSTKGVEGCSGTSGRLVDNAHSSYSWQCSCSCGCHCLILPSLQCLIFYFASEGGFIFFEYRNVHLTCCDISWIEHGWVLNFSLCIPKVIILRHNKCWNWPSWCGCCWGHGWFCESQFASVHYTNWGGQSLWLHSHGLKLLAVDHSLWAIVNLTRFYIKHD